ncbi:MAG: hypothetical protein M1834_000396 [Cirrosporium novae-zelandiae]|nr:MAG: hypothetical protein M1834_000396 [Cirrosporium novae-zelandiae]
MILGISHGATKTEIKKAYHKAALSSHPDKVSEEERDEAEIKFKVVSQAYEILYDDDKRHLYDTQGMAAFDPSKRNGMGPGGEVDLDDILASMFGMGGAMPPGFGGPGGQSKRPKKGASVEQKYEVTLEELYKGKTVKFASSKNVICSNCKGSGGKEKAKPKQCATCRGQGETTVLRQIGPGLVVAHETIRCSSCKGSGSVFNSKDRCKKCKGSQVTEEKKVLEIYIPRGAKEGERIVLEGEADQAPDQEPGDIVFQLVEQEHETFRRAGANLAATIEITLAEALCGFSRVVLKHLDGRGIHLAHPQKAGEIMRPGQVIKIPGEGMPHKKSDMKGDLFLEIDVKFPENGYFNEDTVKSQLQELLPKPAPPITTTEADEVEYEDAKAEDFAAGESDDWEDEEDDEEEEGHPQCAQQ